MSVLPRCQILPLPDQQVSFLVGQRERLRWHFASHYPRPFFYPLVGPGGSVLTRMGHPGAPNHDHHRSIWFAHHKVVGVDFWSDNTAARIRQKTWLSYEDGDEEAAMAVSLAWYDGHDPQELLEQELIVAVRPLEQEELVVELQASFRPKAQSLELGKTNFGLLAVRVAKSISQHFGGGALTDSEGRKGEAAIFGKQARWVDYSGPVSVGASAGQGPSWAGITYFDHPSNPRYPSHWHVRSDGWMGASLCMQQALTIERERPLVLRYQLYAHRGSADAARLDQLAAAFAERPALLVQPSMQQHRQYQISR